MSAYASAKYGPCGLRDSFLTYVDSAFVADNHTASFIITYIIAKGKKQAANITEFMFYFYIVMCVSPYISAYFYLVCYYK